VLLSTPIDYEYSSDARAHKILRIIQDRERNGIRTFTTDIYREFYGISDDSKHSTNIITHESIDNALKRLERNNFIERIRDDKDRRRYEIRSKPEEIYTSMVESDPYLFWRLMEKEYYYFIARYREAHPDVLCPKCYSKAILNVSIHGIKTARFRASDEIAIDVKVKHLEVNVSCKCGFSYNRDADMLEPSTLEDFSKLFDASNSRRNLQ